MRCELFVAEIDPLDVRSRDIDARLWTDATGHESGRYVPMSLGIEGSGAVQQESLESAPLRCSTPEHLAIALSFPLIAT